MTGLNSEDIIDRRSGVAGWLEAALPPGLPIGYSLAVTDTLYHHRRRCLYSMGHGLTSSDPYSMVREVPTEVLD